MTRLPHRRFLQAALAVFAGVLLGGCGKQPEPAKTQKAELPTAQAASAKVYVVGIDAAYAPFESQNEKGEIVGFSVDLMRALAAPRTTSTAARWASARSSASPRSRTA